MTSKPESLSELFESVKATFPTSLGPEKWLLVVATSALVTCSGPFELGQLYLCLMKQPEYSSLPHRRPQLDNHLREFLIREGLAIGASKAATAPEKGQPDNGSITKSPLELNESKHGEDTAFLEKLFGPEGNANLFTRPRHLFTWMANEVVNDMTSVNDWELGAVERQLITYMSLTCQGTLKQDLGPMQSALDELWYTGLSTKHLMQMTERGELVARWADYDMRYWPVLKIFKANGRETPMLYYRSTEGRFAVS